MSDHDQLLINGAAPATVAEIQNRLDLLGYDHSTISHPPMFTVDDSRQHRLDLPGGYSKNLFLRNKKGKMWLVTLKENSKVDLKALGSMIGAGRVSFASPERLMNYLGVLPGAVTPLAVINDTTGVVKAVIESSLLDLDPLHFHPCINSMTTTISRGAILAYMSSFDHEPAQIVLPPAAA